VAAFNAAAFRDACATIETVSLKHCEAQAVKKCTAMLESVDAVFGKGKIISINVADELLLQRIAKWELDPAYVTQMMDFADECLSDLLKQEFGWISQVRSLVLPLAQAVTMWTNAKVGPTAEAVRDKLQISKVDGLPS
jgi:hypothetical protein